MSAARYARPSLAGLALLFVTSACSGASTGNRATAMRDAARTYADAIRWGRLETAAEFVPEQTRAAFLRDKRAAQAEVQIHEYEIRGIDHVVGTEKARVVIAAAWSRAANPVIHHELLEQQWRWQKTHWAMVRQAPVEVAPTAVQPGDAL